MIRSLWRCYSACSVIIVSIQLTAVLFLLSISIGLGLVRVPVVSDILAAPTPTRSATPVAAPPPTPIEQRLFQAASQGHQVQLEVTQAEVNDILKELDKRQYGPLRQMKVEITSSHVSIQGHLPGPLPVPLQVWGRLRAYRGVLFFAADRAASGDVPLPTLVLQPFAEWVNGQFIQALRDRRIPLSVEAVEIRNGVAVIKGILPDGWRPTR